MSIKFTEETYSWGTMSLWQFLKEGNVPSSWKDFFLREDVQQDLFNISNSLSDEVKQGITIYPSINQVFRAFIPLNKIRVVLLGMDPYHNGSAVGLCYSVLPGNAINPSLRNIYTELKNEGYQVNEDGILTHWVDQGVLMINTALTVAKSDADSHTSYWYDFSEKVIKYIAENTENTIWIMTGSKAQEFQKFVTRKTHRVIVTSHPSPLSAYRVFRHWPAFLGSNIFKDVNDHLQRLGEQVIKW